MSQAEESKPEKRHFAEMTVAHIREQKGADVVEVLFLESARIYQLPRNNPNFEQALKRLRAADVKGQALKVQRASPDSDVIEGVV